jgi:hypothetical protein
MDVANELRYRTRFIELGIDGFPLEAFFGR